MSRFLFGEISDPTAVDCGPNPSGRPEWAPCHHLGISLCTGIDTSLPWEPRSWKPLTPMAQKASTLEHLSKFFFNLS